MTISSKDPAKGPFRKKAKKAAGPGASEPGCTDWPGFVKHELRAFLDCGILARGFCRLHCPTCGKDELVAFSCKCRGFWRGTDDAVRFASLPAPTDQEVVALTHKIKRRVLSCLGLIGTYTDYAE